METRKNRYMTVGMAAIAEADTDEPKVIVSSDRLVTTRQQSAIEHEHPDTKLKEFGEFLDCSNLVGIVAGSVGLGEILKDRIDVNLRNYQRQNDEEPWVQTSADIAADVYRRIIQEKIEELVLSDYGLELDDLSKQHQFKDSFMNNILAEVSQMKQSLNQSITLLFGGVGENEHGVYQISNGSMMPKNNMGYCAIGSGVQPAESEFIKSNYSRSNSVSEVLATIAAGHHQAKKASGVGGDPDFVVTDINGTHTIEERVSGELMKRQDKIATKQKNVKHQVLSSQQIDWERE
jgi:20S proteasome alpha/beta subunit